MIYLKQEKNLKRKPNIHRRKEKMEKKYSYIKINTQQKKKLNKNF